MEFNPDGVLIINFFKGKGVITYSNETIKRFFEKDISDDIL